MAERMRWRGREIFTIGDLGECFVGVTTKAEANEFWEHYVTWLVAEAEDLEPRTRDRAEFVARSNIGYWMGYYDAAERTRIYELFDDHGVAHPIFGRTTPTADEAFAAGAAAMTQHLRSPDA